YIDLDVVEERLHAAELGAVRVGRGLGGSAGDSWRYFAGDHLERGARLARLARVGRDDQRLDAEAPIRASVLDDLGRLRAQRMSPGARGGQRHRDRYRNLRGVSAGRARFLTERRDPLPQRFRRHPQRLPAVAQARGTPDGRATDAADHDGNRRLLRGLGRELHAVEARELAVELRLV